MTSCNIDNLSLNNMDFHASVLSSVADYDWVFTWEDTQKIHSMSLTLIGAIKIRR